MCILKNTLKNTILLFLGHCKPLYDNDDDDDDDNDDVTLTVLDFVPPPM